MADRDSDPRVRIVASEPSAASTISSDATLVGRIIDLSGHSWLAGTDVVLVGTTVDGAKVRCASTVTEDGTFEIDVPDVRFWSASVLSAVPGTEPVQLDLHKGIVEPGEVVIVVNEPGPFHVRFGLA
ncbi:MAG: hypothetical protein KDB21_17715 [Acidimicrobiales bacterium]|nr:hypothetical protein [Acidimicrobiales bacterium]